MKKRENAQGSQPKSEELIHKDEQKAVVGWSRYRNVTYAATQIFQQSSVSLKYVHVNR